MIGLRRHLNDDRLYECYFASRLGEPVPPPLADHLTDCGACHQRYADVEAALDAARETGDAEADEIFTAERRQQQHDQILRKLEQLNRSARVISFPGQSPNQLLEGQRRVASRWVAASAAAGLFVGVAVGGWLVGARDDAASARNRQAVSLATNRVAPAATAPVVTSAPEKFDDEAFLRQLEFALANPRTRELEPFDAITPHVREIQTRLR